MGALVPNLDLLAVPGGGEASAAEDVGAAVDATTVRLAEHVAKATSDFDAGNLPMSPAQVRASATSSSLAAANRGQVIDSAVKSAVRNPDLQHLWVSRSGEFGPDFHDIATNTWWDIATEGQFQRHLDLYSEPFGTGIGLFTH